MKCTPRESSLLLCVPSGFLTLLPNGLSQAPVRPPKPAGTMLSLTWLNYKCIGLDINNCYLRKI